MAGLKPQPDLSVSIYEIGSSLKAAKDTVTKVLRQNQITFVAGRRTPDNSRGNQAALVRMVVPS